MAEQDIRENAMSGGTPARLRGLAANGNSISPTIQEVMNAMEIYIFNLTLAAGEEKDLGDLGYGMYLLASPNNAATAIFAFGSYSKGFVSDAGSNFYCDYTDGTKGWGTVCICLHPPTMQQLLYLLLVPIQKVLCQMQVQIFTVIIQMGLKVLLSVEKRQMVAFLSKTTEALKHT